MRRGRCFCGSVRYETTADPAHQTAYHCSMCRRATGAPFVAWFTVPLESFHISGTTTVFNSSDHVSRTFCASCGTHLTFQSSRYPEQVAITTCSLDGEQPAPRNHIFADAQVPWLKLADGLPVYPKRPTRSFRSLPPRRRDGSPTRRDRGRHRDSAR